jgi:hypothetical protein
LQPRRPLRCSRCDLFPHLAIVTSSNFRQDSEAAPCLPDLAVSHRRWPYRSYAVLHELPGLSGAVVPSVLLAALLSYLEPWVASWPLLAGFEPCHTRPEIVRRTEAVPPMLCCCHLQGLLWRFSNCHLPEKQSKDRDSSSLDAT